MSKTKQGGKTRQHRNRTGKRLGLKVFGGQSIGTGQVIIRQRGTPIKPGNSVGLGRDHTLFALRDGVVQYSIRHGERFVSVEARSALGNSR